MSDTTAPVPPVPEASGGPDAGAPPAPAGPPSGAPAGHPGQPGHASFPAYPASPGYPPLAAPLGAVAPRPPVRWWIPVVAVLAGLFLAGAGMAVGVAIGLALGDHDGVSYGRPMDGRPGPMTGDRDGGTMRDRDGRPGGGWQDGGDSSRP